MMAQRVNPSPPAGEGGPRRRRGTGEGARSLVGVLRATMTDAERKDRRQINRFGFCRLSVHGALPSPRAHRAWWGGVGGGGWRGVHRGSGSCGWTPHPRPLPTASRGEGRRKQIDSIILTSGLSSGSRSEIAGLARPPSCRRSTVRR